MIRRRRWPVFCACRNRRFGRVVGYVNDQARRADSALAALACKPLYMHPEDATIGGEGNDIRDTRDDLDNHAELIELVARNTKRPAGLIRGLLCPDLEVYRYTNKQNRTGEVLNCQKTRWLPVLDNACAGAGPLGTGGPNRIRRRPRVRRPAIELGFGRFSQRLRLGRSVSSAFGFCQARSRLDFRSGDRPFRGTLGQQSGA